MSGLKIFTGNRLEILADHLAHTVRTPTATPLQPEIIVIQSRGMERWISMELARRNGICANVAYPFPNAFLHSLIQRLMPDLPPGNPFDPEILTFRIMKTLPAFLDRSAFRSLKNYLADDAKGLKLYQLSNKIADTFDQYLVFRPEMIFQWEAGKGGNTPRSRWQAELWRELVKDKQTLHRARLQKILLNRIGEPVSRDLVPARVNIFGISYLPPFHLQAFAAIAQVAPVYLFILNPCREYWADILTEKEIRKITKKYSVQEQVQGYLYLERGNALLASMGTLGRDFLKLISEYEGEFYDGFEPIAGDDLLSCIQSDILNLIDRKMAESGSGIPIDGAGGSSPPLASAAVRLPSQDTSVQIHACHSPIREIEVLHDRLLAMFEEDPRLLPKDILVMTPNIESHAPFIHAVFGTQIDEVRYIPYNVADQNARQTSRVIDGFFALLDLKDSRFGALRILSLLELPGIKERFGLNSSDVEMLEGWVRELNIRWGIDAGSRSKMGLPGFPENTWKAGIERLLLGVAMPGDADRMFAGILPYDPVEGSDTKVLGKFLEFLDRVFYWSGALGRARSAGGWQALLVQLLEQFFFVDESTERQIQLIRQALDSLGRMENLAQYDRSIELEVVRIHLERLLAQTTYGTGFISGGVTFCAMLPMRSIPFKIVCLIGMDNGAYPREQRQPGFDLIARYPRSGDRSRRKDDRYLFLEALVSARQKLYISYVGQSIQDNTGIPPSVLVSELIDYIQQGFGLSEDDLVIQHPLQAYSPRYFSKEEPRLYSYSKENCIAVAKMDQREIPTAFIASPLSEPADEWRNLSIEQLSLFFSNPAKYLLQRRLGLRFESRGPVSEDRENFSLDPLQRYQINQQLAQNRLSGVDPTDNYRIQQARGNLPLGNVGRVVYGVLDQAAETFISGVEGFTRGENPGRKDVDLNIADFNLQGTLTDLYPRGRIQIRYAAIKPKDMLTAWINHLILCAQDQIFCPPETILIGSNAAMQFETVEHPLKILQDLLMLYWQGLSAPLHFFPESSYTYANLVLHKGKSKADALKGARNKWRSSDFIRGESEDPYYRQCFERMDPIDGQFEHIAVKVLPPLFEHTEKLVIFG